MSFTMSTNIVIHIVDKDVCIVYAVYLKIYFDFLGWNLKICPRKLI